MGRCPTGTVLGGLQRGGRKRGLQTDLQNEIVQEIETLLGHTAPADLDFEAIEMAARRQALRLAAHALAQRLNADTSDHVGAELPVPAGPRPNIMVGTRRPSKAFWDFCSSRALTTTVSNARADSARETAI